MSKEEILPQWQPISTAPLDGAAVLVYSLDDRKIYVALYEYKKWWPQPETSDTSAVNPTHWMPLPPTPNKPTKEE